MCVVVEFVVASVVIYGVKESVLEPVIDSVFIRVVIEPIFIPEVRKFVEASVVIYGVVENAVISSVR